MMMYNSQLFRSSEVDSPGMIREEAEGREAEGENEERDG
jgi:hypothetical protein